MSANDFYDYKTTARCKRCGLTVDVPQGNQDAHCLMSCPSCSKVVDALVNNPRLLIDVLRGSTYHLEAE